MKKFFLLLAVLAASIVFTTSCHTNAPRYIDRYVSPKDTIPLQQGSVTSGSWDTFEIEIDYRYQNDSQFHIDGSAQLGSHFQALYERISQFDLYLFLLDDTSRVIDTVPLGTEVMADTRSIIDFAHTMTLTHGTKRIAFGYEARLRGGDPEPGNNSVWIYQLPLATSPLP